jgi:hypothetical protein
LLSFSAQAQSKSVYKVELKTDKYNSYQHSAAYRNGYFYLAGQSDDNNKNELQSKKGIQQGY